MHVLITGANRGIGRALAETLAARGDRVTGTSRGAPPAMTGIGWLTMDVTDPASVRNAATACDGPIDLLICNAGAYMDKGQPLDDGFPPQMWAEQLAINVTGVFQTAQAFLPKMAANGRIALMASQMGSSQNAAGGSYLYRASKAAVVNMARNLAVDLKARGIAVGAYHPGWVRTDMGGAQAPVGTDDSATGLVARFDELTLETTGCFRSFNGDTLPF